MKNINYIAPAVEVVEMAIEQGIAASMNVSGIDDIYLYEENVDW